MNGILKSNKRKQVMAQFQTYLHDNKNAHYRMAYSYAKGAEDAWDIVHDSIEKGLRAIDREAYPESMNAWFYRILVNTSLDFLKKRKRLIHYEPEALEAMVETVDQYQDFDLHEALDQLPTVIKTIVVLRYFEDLKISDIASILGENENTVKTRLYKGLKLLRVALEEEPYEST